MWREVQSGRAWITDWNVHSVVCEGFVGFFWFCKGLFGVSSILQVEILASDKCVFYQLLCLWHLQPQWWHGSFSKCDFQDCELYFCECKMVTP